MVNASKLRRVVKTEENDRPRDQKHAHLEAPNDPTSGHFNPEFHYQNVPKTKTKKTPQSLCET